MKSNGFSFVLLSALTLSNCSFSSRAGDAEPPAPKPTAPAPAPTPPAPAADQPPPPSIYTRMKGLPQIADIADALAVELPKDSALAENPQLKKALAEIHPGALRFHLTAVLCQLAGGPERYTGRSVTELRKEYKVSDKDWKALMALLTMVLEQSKAGKLEQKDLVAAAEAVMAEILDIETRTYRNPSHGFSILFPAGWEVQEGKAGSVVMAIRDAKTKPEVFHDNINIKVEDLPVEMTAPEYVKSALLDLYRQIKDFKPGETASARINNQPAEAFVYSHKVGGVAMSTATYVLVLGKKGYQINCDAADERMAAIRPVVVEAIKTLQLFPVTPDPKR